MRNFDEEEKVLTLPYYIITYIDDEGKKHIAMIKDPLCVDYYKTRFTVLLTQIVVSN